MKNLIAGTILTMLGLHLLQTDSRNVKTIEKKQLSIIQPLLRVHTLQDVSESTTKLGGELIHSSVFTPFYEQIRRPIELGFGLISSNSARKPITVFLPAAEFIRPEFPSLNSLGFYEQQKAKAAYYDALSQYETDSLSFVKNRKLLFQRFCNSIDSILEQYRGIEKVLVGVDTIDEDRLCDTTDLITALNVADRHFNSVGTQSSENVLLLSTDGKDSYNRTIEKFVNDIHVVLINAGEAPNSSIANIVSQEFPSIEQAIAYTLQQPKR